MRVRTRILSFALFIFFFLGSSTSSRELAAQSHLLLKDDTILDVLGVEPDRRAELKKIVDSSRKEEKKLEMRLTQGKDFDALPSARQEEVRTQYLEEVQTIDRAASAEVGKILGEEQVQRLNQIRIQILGPGGFMSGALDQDLGINATIRKELIAMAQEFQSSFPEQFKSEIEGKSRAEIQRIYQARLIERFLQELGPEKESLYRALAGEPIADLPSVPEIR